MQVVTLEMLEKFLGLQVQQTELVRQIASTELLLACPDAHRDAIERQYIIHGKDHLQRIQQNDREAKQVYLEELKRQFKEKQESLELLLGEIRLELNPPAEFLEVRRGWIASRGGA